MAADERQSVPACCEGLLNYRRCSGIDHSSTGPAAALTGPTPGRPSSSDSRHRQTERRAGDEETGGGDGRDGGMRRCVGQAERVVMEMRLFLSVVLAGC